MVSPSLAVQARTHGAAVFDAETQNLATAEDVGRHNAVDKVVGRLLAQDSLTQGQLLVVSGRVSFEIVQKAAACWISGDRRDFRPHVDGPLILHNVSNLFSPASFVATDSTSTRVLSGSPRPEIQLFFLKRR